MRRLPETLLVATHNAGKLAEFRALFEPFGIAVQGAAEHGLAEPDETGTTFLENARIKAQAAQAATGLAVLADDSGIEVDALGGQPGVYTADWAETPNGRDFKLAMTRTHEALEAINAPHPRRARFRATLVLLWEDGSETIAEGACDGQIVWPMRGLEGHGFDPCFQADGFDITMGEMTPDAKNAISHRGRALSALAKMLGLTIPG